MPHNRETNPPAPAADVTINNEAVTLYRCVPTDNLGWPEHGRGFALLIVWHDAFRLRLIKPDGREIRRSYTSMNDLFTDISKLHNAWSIRPIKFPQEENNAP